MSLRALCSDFQALILECGRDSPVLAGQPNPVHSAQTLVSLKTEKKKVAKVSGRTSQDPSY